MMLSTSGFSSPMHSHDPFSPKGNFATGSFSHHQTESPYSGTGGSNMMSVSPDHQHPLTTSGSSSYLPNYLLGAAASPPTTPQFGRSLSNVSHAQSPQVHGWRVSSPQIPSQIPSSDPRSSQKRISPLIQHGNRDKPRNAPPVEGLYDNERCNIDEIYTTGSWNNITPSRSILSSAPRSLNTPGSAINTEISLDASVFSPRHDGIAQSPAQLDPFYTQGENLTTHDILDERWVTIFGFPPSLVGFVLEQFTQYGFIERKEIPSNVNWLHIQYQTKLQAKKALSKNGKILNGNIMIGVCQCISKDVMEKKQDASLNRSVFGTHSKDLSQTTTPKQSAIRPLTAAYNAAANQNKVMQEGRGTPQRNNSFVSKAMEYVLGI